MSGMEPILIGSALGAVTNRRNPLAGALMGGVLGGVGGAAMGGFKAAGSAGTAGLAGGGGSGMGVAGTLTNAGAGGASAYYPVTQVASPANPLMPIGQSAIGTTPTFMEQMRGGFQGITNFAKENPFAMSTGLNAAKELYGQQQPMAAAVPQGLLRGTPSQEQPQQYAMAMPQVSLI